MSNQYTVGPLKQILQWSHYITRISMQNYFMVFVLFFRLLCPFQLLEGVNETNVGD